MQVCQPKGNRRGIHPLDGLQVIKTGIIRGGEQTGVESEDEQPEQREEYRAPQKRDFNWVTQAVQKKQNYSANQSNCYNPGIDWKEKIQNLSEYPQDCQPTKQLQKQ